MSRQKTTRRLERRSEREARKPGGGPRPQRQRTSRTPARAKSSGLSGINWTPILAGIGAIAIVGLIGFATMQTLTAGDPSTPSHRQAEQDNSPNLPGVYFPPHPEGAYHFGEGVRWPICTAAQIEAGELTGCYHSNPPTSGPHSARPAAFQVYENPVPKENLLHTMEHGAVIIWYNTSNEQVIKELAEIANRAISQRKLVTMTRYTEMEPETVALTAWTRLDKFPVSEFERRRVERFIDTHQRRYNPEGF